MYKSYSSKNFKLDVRHFYISKKYFDNIFILKNHLDLKKFFRLFFYYTYYFILKNILIRTKEKTIKLKTRTINQ